ncbi:MAG: glycosyl hydrolase 53 family protein [Lachnospiraceae bacterium]|nr:glycosyl hydrolase 53 family protein [Lachnospiraceae bacterium]
MKIKRSITTVLSVALMSVSLFGCGSSTPQNADAAGNAPAVENTVEEDKGETVAQTYFPQMPADIEESEIFVQKIDNIPEGFIRGMDISSLLSEEASGVKYYDENGEEQDLLKILADSGINCVRVRVWVDPFDSEGKGFGGGNCTAETAAEIGKRAAAYGISTCVDFHYSDFWADPGKQMVPKAWKDMSLDEKAKALSDYTKESLDTITKAGAKVIMVQIGNEINNGMSGEKGLNNKLKLVKAGCDATREFAREKGLDLSVVLHYTQIDDKKNILEIARQLQSAKVDYDVFGVSYYPYWHGSIENMTEVLKEVAQTYGVKTCVMETAYPYTDEDGDGTANSVSGTSVKNSYPVSIQGQANAIRDITKAAIDGGSLGIFYWEGAWIPVGGDPKTNSELWEEYGSGWASSFAADYDPDDAGKYFGGTSWDNQAFFDFEGHKLPSLDVFKYIDHGARGKEVEILTDLEDEDAISVDVSIGAAVSLPEDINVVYNDTSVDEPLHVAWNEDEINAIDTNTAGVYYVNGKAECSAMPGKETAVKARVNVANINYIVNPGFEEEVGEEWIAETFGGGTATDIQDKEADAHGGTKAFHFYKAKEFSFDMHQELTDIPAGNYVLSAYVQGGDMGSESSVVMYIDVNGQRYETGNIGLDGWQQWKEMKIEDIAIKDGDSIILGCEVTGGAGGWGTIDDFDLSLK